MTYRGDSGCWQEVLHEGTNIGSVRKIGAKWMAQTREKDYLSSQGFETREIAAKNLLEHVKRVTR
jgi:hypothetical protein